MILLMSLLQHSRDEDKLEVILMHMIALRQSQILIRCFGSNCFIQRGEQFRCVKSQPL